MADYNSMKVPELKKLLNERGLTQAGNKADLIARLVDNDKQSAKASEPETEAKTKKGDDEDEIDYDDDDYPVAPVSAKPAAAVATSTAAAATSAPAASTPAPAKSAPAPAKSEAKTVAPAAPTTTTDAPATSTATENGADKKTTEDAAEPAAPLFSQHLAPTNAKTEAEKRAARAARFGIVADKESEDARKVARVERFGLANDAVAALDSALPDRPRKRGRDRAGEDKEEDSRANKRRSGGASGPVQGGRNANAGGRGNANTNTNNSNSNANGGRGNRRNRRGSPQEGGPRAGAGGNVQKKAPAAVDPAEKAKMEARAKRFAAST